MREWIALAWAGVAMAAPAHSAVTARSETGFAIENSVGVSANAEDVYALLATPGRWWNGEHSYSGDAANLSLEPKAGGCFCEALPAAHGAAGSVEHARVIHAVPGKQLRLSGALGPLQAEAVTGTLTFDIRPARAGVRVTFTYVVGGYIRQRRSNFAPIVDKVLAEQLVRLKRVAERSDP